MQLPKKGTFLSNCARQSKSGRVGAGGGVTQKTSYGGGGGLRPDVQPLTFEHPVFERKGTPFVYLLSTNGTPFTYLVQNLESLSTALNVQSQKF